MLTSALLMCRRDDWCIAAAKTCRCRSQFLDKSERLFYFSRATSQSNGENDLELDDTGMRFLIACRISDIFKLIKCRLRIAKSRIIKEITNE